MKSSSLKNDLHNNVEQIGSLYAHVNFIELAKIRRNLNLPMIFLPALDLVSFSFVSVAMKIPSK